MHPIFQAHERLLRVPRTGSVAAAFCCRSHLSEDIKRKLFKLPPRWATGCILPLESQCLCVYWALVDNGRRPASSCLVISACVNVPRTPRVLETRGASPLWPSPFISHPFHPQFFMYLTRWVEVNPIIVPWKDEWMCECFHVSSVIKLHMKGPNSPPPPNLWYFTEIPCLL